MEPVLAAVVVIGLFAIGAYIVLVILDLVFMLIEIWGPRGENDE